MSPEPDSAAVDVILSQIDAARKTVQHRPVVLGLCGAQGSGKSTIAAALERQLRGDGLDAATLSLDDLYLTHGERQRLAQTVHPLLATRGVPGTHDVSLGERTLAALAEGKPTRLPRFDKGVDDRAPVNRWPKIEMPLDVLILEGWCVGAVPEAEAALERPVNALEEREDPHGIWRRYVNDALGARYQHLFARIDRLVLLAAPSFEIVRKWRTQQEDALRATKPEGIGVMDNAGIVRFIQHYERLTRHILCEMPDRADLVLRLNEDRSVASQSDISIAPSDRF